MYYQVIYVNRAHEAMLSRLRFASADEARERLDTVIIGAGLIVEVNGGEVRPVVAVAEDGTETRYAYLQHRAEGS